MQLTHRRPSYTTAKTLYTPKTISNWQPDISESYQATSNLKLTLSKICELTNFPYGEIWLPNPENDLLELTPDYHVVAGTHQDDLEQFYYCSQDFIVSQGEGLPGRVWLERKPEWLLDASAESEGYFLRNKIAGVFGVQTGFAIPLVIEERVLMIMAFFACELRPNTSQFLTTAMDLANKSYYQNKVPSYKDLMAIS